MPDTTPRLRPIIRMPKRQKERIPRKVCPDGSIRPSNIPCPPRKARPRTKLMTRTEQFKKERLGR